MGSSGADGRVSPLPGPAGPEGTDTWVSRPPPNCPLLPLSLKASVEKYVPGATSGSPPFLHTWACTGGQWGGCPSRGQRHALVKQTQLVRRFSNRCQYLGKRHLFSSVQLHDYWQFAPPQLMSPVLSYWPFLPPLLYPFLPVFSTTCFQHLPPHLSTPLLVTTLVLSHLFPTPVPHTCSISLPHASLHTCPYLSSHPCFPKLSPFPLTHGTVEVLAAPAGRSAWG